MNVQKICYTKKLSTADQSYSGILIPNTCIRLDSIAPLSEKVLRSLNYSL